MADQLSEFIYQNPIEQYIFLPKNAISLLVRMAMPVDNPTMVDLSREMIPILAEVYTLGPENNKHPAIIQLFNWLVDLQRTAEEFIYVIRSLRRRVKDLMAIHFPLYLPAGNPKHLIKVAVEALAVKCPIIEGPWEEAMHILVVKIHPYDNEINGFASDYLSAWIIHVIGDLELCPDFNLRIELMTLLVEMVDLNDNNRTQAIESVLDACSSVNADYLIKSQRGLEKIINVLWFFTDHGHTLHFDKKLAESLLFKKTSRLSNIFHDVAQYSAVNSKIYAQPTPVLSLTVLLKCVTGYAQSVYKDLQEKLRSGEMNVRLGGRINDITSFLYLLLNNFKKSCQTSQLVNHAALCIMVILELLIVFDLREDGMNIISINILLGNLYHENDVINKTDSPVWLEITHKNKDRLNNIRKLSQDYNTFDTFHIPNIKALFIE